MPNNLHSYQIIFCMGFACFLGTFLAYTANAQYKKHYESTQFGHPKTKDHLIGSIPMGILVGCIGLAIGSVDVGYLESYSLAAIFFYVFFLSLLTGGIDTWLGFIKLIFSKVIPANNNN